LGVWWREIVPEPAAFLLLYALAWVTILTAGGLYRPRARWSLRSEAVDILRATAVMALLTLSVLFLFHLPDVSRLLLLVLFPAQAAVTIALRAGLRAWLERAPQGRNARLVLVWAPGRGPVVRDQAGEPPRARPAGVGSTRSRPGLTWVRPPLGGLGPGAVLHERIVDEVAICLPFSQWTLIDAIAHLCEEEGKIVRIPMDVSTERSRRPVGSSTGRRSSRSFRARPELALPPSGHSTAARSSGSRPVAPARSDRDRHPVGRRRARAVPAGADRPPRPAVPGRQVPVDGRRRRGAADGTR
jgi:hypothetical protein